MRKIYWGVMLLFITFFSSNLHAQCSSITPETFPLDPQSGNHNYFGVRVTLAYTFPENVTVYGYIYDEGEPNTNHPFELTVTAGNLTAETSATFYETSPTSNAIASISSATPCPSEYIETTAGSYSLTNHTYTLNVSSQNEGVLSALEDLFSLENPVIDSLKINDDDPAIVDSAAYLVFYVTADNRKFSFGLSLNKQNDGNNHIIYNLNNSVESVARAWECKKNSECSQCGPHRNWFLGPVRGCDCVEAGETNNDCIFNTSGSGIPWGPIIAGVAAIIAAIL